jgi:hypothetical protein
MTLPHPHPPKTPSRIAKEEAIARIGKHIAALNALLDQARTRMAATPRPGRYAQNFQVNAIRKEIHAWKRQADRLRKGPRAEVPWDESLGW